LEAALVESPREVNMARAAATNKRPSNRGKRRATTFDPREIIDLRRMLGRLMGKEMAPRDLIARLVESSPGSVYNWERGTAPTRHYIAKLSEIRRRAETGQLNLSKSTGKGMRPIRVDPVSAPAQIEDSLSASKPAFSNVLEARVDGENTWVLFGLSRPGASRADTIFEVVVPTRLLDRLKG
jgi:hypothetical protein